ncbi:MAG TPA: hypothetical protein VH092_31130 [Urbifossiella sp.]|nr:hypothetical protein [Urbifossiella sp.]
MRGVRIVLWAVAGVLSWSAVAPAGPTLPAKPVEGGLVLGDPTTAAQKHVLPTGVKALDSFQATLTRDKLILDIALTWDWETPERAARAAGKDDRVNRLPWASASGADLVLKTKDGELVCPLADVSASPTLLSLGGFVADAKAESELFKTLRDPDSPAVLRVTVGREVATPAVDLRLKVDRARATEYLERKLTLLGGQVTATELETSARELLREKVVTYTVGDGQPADPAATAWLTELAAKRFVGVLKEQALKEVKPAGPKPPVKGKEKDETAFAWDRIKVAQFQKATGEITGTYSSVVTYRRTLTIPVNRLKLADQKNSFLDLRGK